MPGRVGGMRDGAGGGSAVRSLPGGGAAPLRQEEDGEAEPSREEPRLGPSAALHGRERQNRRIRAAPGSSGRCERLCLGQAPAAPPRSLPRVPRGPPGVPRVRGGGWWPRLGGNCCAQGAPPEAARLGSARPGRLGALGAGRAGGGPGAGTVHRGRACGGSRSRTGLVLPSFPAGLGALLAPQGMLRAGKGGGGAGDIPAGVPREGFLLEPHLPGDLQAFGPSGMCPGRGMTPSLSPAGDAGTPSCHSEPGCS